MRLGGAHTHANTLYMSKCISGIKKIQSALFEVLRCCNSWSFVMLQLWSNQIQVLDDSASRCCGCVPPGWERYYVQSAGILKWSSSILQVFLWRNLPQPVIFTVISPLVFSRTNVFLWINICSVHVMTYEPLCDGMCDVFKRCMLLRAFVYYMYLSNSEDFPLYSVPVQTFCLV